MTKKALELMIERKKLVMKNGDSEKTQKLLIEAQKAGGLTVEEQYVLALYNGNS